MGLFRLFLLAAIAWLIWRVLLRAALPAQPSPPPGAGKPASRDDYQPLTQCTICGAHIPRPADDRAPICERCRSR